MFKLTIEGNSIEEIFDKLEVLRNTKLSASTHNNEANPIPVQPNINPAPPTDTATFEPSIVVPAASPAPQTQDVAIPTTVPNTANPAPVTPVVPTGAPVYTLDQLARAGAALAQAGKMNEALALLAKYGIQTVSQLKPEQYGAFATELRALGAQV